jgi:patatin-like phospholipase/acyl hydrolase
VRFQILCLSGGGYLGLYTAHILDRLEQTAGRPLGSCFDLISGTSIGGILGLGLAHEVPVATITEAFERDGERIFSSRPPPQSKWAQRRDLLRFLCRPKYRSDTLRQVVESLLGATTKLGTAKHRVIVPAVNMTTGSPQLFKTPHHPTFVRDLHRLSADIALATSAAPTLLPLAEMDSALYADGGLFANSPDLLALHEARHFLRQPIEDIHVLSIGTTTSKMSLAHATGREFGIFQWMRGQRLIATILSSQQQIVDFMLSHQLDGRYCRIDTLQSREHERQLGLDVANADARATIRGLADAAAQRAFGASDITAFLQHTAPAPEFFAS